jgi:hypothetical protein
MITSLTAILENLERQDIYRLAKYGMPEELQREIKALCVEYRDATTEDRNAAKSAVISQATKATGVILSFVSRMAELAMQQGDKEALDLGLVALDLSNIMKVDFRDAGGAASRLAFAAERCGINVIDRAQAMIPDISPQLLLFLQHRKPPRVELDGEGKLIFWNPWSKTSQQDAPKK